MEFFDAPAKRSTCVLTKRAQPLQPPPSLSYIHALDHADQSRSCRRNADEREVLSQAFQAMCAEPQAVNDGGHTHRYNDTRGSARQELCPSSFRGIEHGETGPQRLFEERLQKRRH